MTSLGDDTPTDNSSLKCQLQAMDDEDFEHFVADLWGRQGWETKVSQKSRDKSLDVLAEKDDPYHQRHAIQAKRYQAGNRVGGPKISEYASLRDQFDADAALVVATSGFTKDAQERANTLNVKLVDGDDLVKMVRDNNAYDLIHKHTDESSPDLQANVIEADLALQQMNAFVRVPPKDADELGIFNDVPEPDTETDRLEALSEIVEMADDVHFDGDGNVFVEDITEYVSASKIVGNDDPPIAGVIDPDAKPKNWKSTSLIDSIVNLF